MPSLPSQLCKPTRWHRRCPTRTSHCATNPTFCNNCCIKATTQADHPSASISSALGTHGGYYSCVSEGGFDEVILARLCAGTDCDGFLLGFSCSGTGRLR